MVGKFSNHITQPPIKSDDFPQYNDEIYCKNEAPLFLLVGGGITVGMTALKLIAFLTPCEFDDKVANFLTPIANLANFCVLIWGTVVVFGEILGFLKLF